MTASLLTLPPLLVHDEHHLDALQQRALQSKDEGIRIKPSGARIAN